MSASGELQFVVLRPQWGREAGVACRCLAFRPATWLVQVGSAGELAIDGKTTCI